jgi:hypothetical protein
MLRLKDRLERSEALLAMIDHLRQETGKPGLGEDIERILIDRVIRDLEEDGRRLREHQPAPVNLRRAH